MTSGPAARITLICFPHAGGGPAAYRPWVDRLAPGVELVAVQLPGHERRLPERPLTALASLVDGIVGALGETPNERPFCFFGHSLGSLLSFELARALRRLGRPLPLLLMVSGHPAPQLPRRRRKLGHLPDRDLLNELLLLDGTGESALQDAELATLMLPAIRADLAAAEGYTYREEPPLRCGIRALRGRADPRVGETELDAWRPQTFTSFAARTYEGGHFYLRGAPAGFFADLERELRSAAGEAG